MDKPGKKARLPIAAGIVAVGLLLVVLISVRQGLVYNRRLLDGLSGRMKNLESSQERLVQRVNAAQQFQAPGAGNVPSPTQLSALMKAIDSLREGRFNDMVDRITREAATDRERAVLMAEHVCATVRNECDSSRHNYSKVSLDSITDPLTAWEYRFGVCGWRAQILVRALARMNIKAEIFNIYDYDFGHSCVLATYGGQDHFFDPTYGGYFADSTGRVLSWKEVAANPKAAISGMKTFPTTLDCYGNGERVENTQRMNDIYTTETIASVKNAGTLGSRIFLLPVALDLTGIDKGPVFFGAENGSETDMRDESVHRSTRCWYLDYLGYNLDKFAYSLNLTGLGGGKPVDIRLKFCKAGRGGAQWQASSKTGKITAGADGPVAANATEWTITYKPGGTGPQAVEIRLSQYLNKSWSMLDCIEVARAD